LLVNRRALSFRYYGLGQAIFRAPKIAAQESTRTVSSLFYAKDA
jgi:hypothetical protein